MLYNTLGNTFNLFRVSAPFFFYIKPNFHLYYWCYFGLHLVFFLSLYLLIYPTSIDFFFLFNVDLFFHSTFSLRLGNSVGVMMLCDTLEECIVITVLIFRCSKKSEKKLFTSSYKSFLCLVVLYLYTWKQKIHSK